MKLPKHKKRHLELVLVSMIDMFTILIIYLLSQTSTKFGGIIANSAVRLPASSSRIPAIDTLKITITKTDILVNESALISLDAKGKVREPEMEGLMISRLRDYLDQFRPADDAPPPDPSKNESGPSVLIIADKEVPFETLRNVMFTAGQQTFSDFRFGVIKKTVGP